MRNGKQGSALIVCVAVNGYQFLYRELFESHRAYAQRHGYDYLLIDKPVFCSLGPEVAWLKVLILRFALKQGYIWVVSLDADTSIAADAPPLHSVYQPGKSIYFGPGYSGRLNSGVWICLANADSIGFVDRVISAVHEPLEIADPIGWGENDYVISVASGSLCTGYLDRRWNNNSDNALHDYIRHYSAGPLRNQFLPPVADLAAFRVLQIITRLSAFARKVIYRPSLPETLQVASNIAHKLLDQGIVARCAHG